MAEATGFAVEEQRNFWEKVRQRVQASTESRDSDTEESEDEDERLDFDGEVFPHDPDGKYFHGLTLARPVSFAGATFQCESPFDGCMFDDEAIWDGCDVQ